MVYCVVDFLEFGLPCARSIPSFTTSMAVDEGTVQVLDFETPKQLMSTGVKVSCAMKIGSELCST